MAKVVSIPTISIPEGEYGPYLVDNIPSNSVGVRLTLARSTDGIWPLTAADPVLVIPIEGLFDGQWLSLGTVTFFGGRSPENILLPARLQETAEIRWARRNPSGSEPAVWVPHVPTQARLSLTVAATLFTGGSFQWL
jgi:hypothetical protein